MGTIINLKDGVAFAKDSIVSKIIVKNDKGNITLFAFDQGQMLSEHTAPFDAFVQVTEGKGTIYIDKQEYSLKEGDAILMPANIPHAVEAKQAFKMLLTMIKG